MLKHDSELLSESAVELVKIRKTLERIAVALERAHQDDPPDLPETVGLICRICGESWNLRHDPCYTVS